MSTYLNFDVDNNYPIQWILESELARDAYRELLFKTALAKEGLPAKNLYQEKMASNVRRIDDPEKRKKFLDMCACLPVGRSFALAGAVDNRANQLAGGVDSYECEVNDPWGVIDNKTEDLLAAQCQLDYTKAGLQGMAAQFSDDLTWAGVVAVLVKYNERTKSNEIYRVNPKNIWFDTKYSALGQERFRGFSTMISWAALKGMIEHDGDEINYSLELPDRSIIERKAGKDKLTISKDLYGTTKIKTINDLDIYVKDLNELAAAPGLQGPLDRRFSEYTHDLNECYNLGWYRSYATDPEARTKSGYNGDDVELTVMYDLARKVEFKIINRRYVISKNEKAFRRVIPFEVFDPFAQIMRLEPMDYELNCPLIFKFERRNMDIKPYPQAPVFPLLPLHDELCSLVAKRQHVTDIISLLRIVANAGDADTLADQMNVMGLILDDIQGDIQSIVLNYDYTPLDSEIARLEADIKKKLKAFDDFDAMAQMGDRATAAESGQAQGAIANGLTTLQQTVMSLYSEIARQCIGNHVTYSPDSVFRVWNGGGYSTLTIQQMATLAIVDAKPKLAKKVHERMLATNAIALIGSMGRSGLINQRGLAYLLEQALYGQIPRGLAAEFIAQPTTPPEVVKANALEAQNMAMMLQQNNDMYQENPIPYEANDTAQNLSLDEMDSLIAQYSAQQRAEAEGEVSQTPQLVQNEQGEDIGVSLGEAGLGSEAAGELANMVA